MKRFGMYLLGRIKEPSTWRGIAMLATVAGCPAGTVDATLQLGLAIVGVIGVFAPDKKRGVTE